MFSRQKECANKKLGFKLKLINSKSWFIVSKMLFFAIYLAMTACSTKISEMDNEVDNLKICVISLDRTPERFEFEKSQLEKEGVKNYTRFRAVDGYLLDFKELKTRAFLNDEQKKNFRKYTWSQKPVTYDVFLKGRKLLRISVKERRMSLGEVGVTCSHREIWKKLLKSNYDKVLIIEDDVIFDKNFKNKLNAYIKDLPEDWDIAYLMVGHPHTAYKYFPNFKEAFGYLDDVKGHHLVAKILPKNRGYGTCAYLINHRGARKLLKKTEGLSLPIDDIIFHSGIGTGEVIGYTAKEYMGEPILGDSEIKRMGRGF